MLHAWTPDVMCRLAVDTLDALDARMMRVASG